jgi:hypothetical protein
MKYKMIFKVKKLLLPLLALVLMGCEGNPSTSIKNTKHVEVINPMTQKLLGDWQSDYLLKDGDEVPSGQASVLSFKREALFEILGMEQGGEWKVNEDTLQITTQTTDEFLIVELSDTVLHTKGIGTDTTDYFFKRVMK